MFELVLDALLAHRRDTGGITVTEPQICRIPMTRRSVGRQIESENRGPTYPSGTYRNGRAKRLGLEILVACERRASGVSCRGGWELESQIRRALPSSCSH